MTPGERKTYATQITESKRLKEEEQQIIWHQAAKHSAEIWSDSTPAPSDHPYLLDKHIPPQHLRCYKGNLVIPIRDKDGILSSLQFITVNGTKRFKTGGKLSGNYAYIGKPTDTVYLCEGYATAASIHESTRCIVIICFGTNNISAVTRILKDKYPSKQLVICADNDAETEGNPGMGTARDVAEKFSIPWTYPELDGNKCDFNDLHQRVGVLEVARQINAHICDSIAPTTDSQEPHQLFRVTDSGVHYFGDDDPYLVCSPLEVTAITRDKNNQNYGRLLNWMDIDGNTHQWAMPMDMLAADGVDLRKVLLSGGLTHIGGGKAKKLLMDYIALANPEKRAICVTKTGWHGSTFVLPDCVIGQSDREQVIFQTEAGESNHFRCKSTLNEWREHVSRHCIGNTRLIFAASMAFAGPLLQITSMDGGGFNFKGNSSEGKSTALQVAASVCGGREYVCTWRATSNGLEGVAASHNDSLLVLDEMGQVAPKEAGEISYMLANGQGKQRASRTGAARQKYEWKVLFLSSGEISLADLLLTNGQKIKAGQEVRLADIPMDTGKYGGFENLHGFGGGSAFADHLKQTSSIYHGTAFRDYLSFIADKLEIIERTAKTIQRNFIEEHCPAKASGQVKRVAGRFALVAAGGDFATAAGITGWPQDEAVHAAEVCFKAWLSDRGSIGNAEDAKALEQVTQFFQQHEQSRFASWEGEDNQRIIDRVGYVQRSGGETLFYVFPQQFKSVICKGINPKRVQELLLARDLLVTDTDRKDISRKPKITNKSERFICVKGDIING